MRVFLDQGSDLRIAWRGPFERIVRVESGEELQQLCKKKKTHDVRVTHARVGPVCALLFLTKNLFWRACVCLFSSRSRLGLFLPRGGMLVGGLRLEAQWGVLS